MLFNHLLEKVFKHTIVKNACKEVMELYLWLTLARLSDLAGVLSVLTGLASTFLTILHLVAREDPFPSTLDYIKKAKWFCLSLFFVFLIFYVLCPNKTDLALMFGWDALKSETAQEVFELVKERLK